MGISETIRAFIVDSYLFGEEHGLTDDCSFLEEGLIDSTGIMQLVSFIEEKYAIVVSDEELTPENLDSINRVAAFVEGKLRPGGERAGA